MTNDATDHAVSDYPLDVFAARLRWLFANPDLEVTFDDWRAGPLALASVGEYRVVYGGDAAEEGWIGVSVVDADGEFVYDIPEGDGNGQIEAESWDALRAKVRRAVSGDHAPDLPMGPPVVPAFTTAASDLADAIDRFVYDHVGIPEADRVESILRTAEAEVRAAGSDAYVAANPNHPADTL